MQIAGVVALVTGGASGLGGATVRLLVERGGRTGIVDRDADKGEALAAELGDAAVFVQADVTSEDDVAAAVARAESLGPLRVNVNCAGIGWAARTVNRDGSPHDFGVFRKVLEVNLFGTFNAMRLSASAMSCTEPLADGARGVVVNTASIAAFDGQIGQVAYSASKGAVVGMTLPAARDLAAAGIRVCTVAPGSMDTPLLALLPDPNRQKLVDEVPFPKRLGTVEEFAALVVHVVENDYMNAETIRIDGGVRFPPK